MTFRGRAQAGDLRGKRALVGVGFNAPMQEGEVPDDTRLRAAAESGPMKGVLAVTDEPLVSSDFNHIDASSTLALPQTQVIEGKLARVLAWYDNEWGFSTRMADTALAMGKLL